MTQPRAFSPTLIDSSHADGPGSGPNRCSRSQTIHAAEASPPRNASRAARGHDGARKAACSAPSTTIAGTANRPVPMIQSGVPGAGKASTLKATRVMAAAREPT